MWGAVRRVASQVGTSTRAVYSLFDSKDGLIAALAAHGFDLLAVWREGLAALIHGLSRADAHSL
jgi:AcrR family transcriptional regulator